MAPCLDDFYKVYSETGERQGFSIRPKEYLAGFLAAFPAAARLYMCYAPSGEPICGGLAVNYAGKTAHVCSCSSDDHELRRSRATYLLQWEMMKWALSTGCRIYDMRGRHPAGRQRHCTMCWALNKTSPVRSSRPPAGSA